MITENKVIEIFCMADDFCKFFDAMTAKYTLKPIGKRKYQRSSTMSKAEVMLIMILFHDSVNEKPLGEVLADISLVPDRLTIHEFHKRIVFQWFAVVNVSRCYHKVEDLSFLIAD